MCRNKLNLIFEATKLTPSAWRGPPLSSASPNLNSRPVPRKWVVRLHLPKGHAVASFDSAVVVKPETLPPMPEGEMYFPFGGSGSPPAHLAGSVFEFQLLTGGSRGATSTSIELVVGAF